MSRKSNKTQETAFPQATQAADRVTGEQAEAVAPEKLAAAAEASEKALAVVNGARITAGSDSAGGFNVHFNGRFIGWKKTLEEAEALLAKAKGREVAHPPAEPEKPAQKSPKGSKKAEKALAPASEQSPKSDPPEPKKAPELVGPIHLALSAHAADEAGRRAALVSILAEAPDDLFRAEAERRGMRLTAARPSNGARAGNRGPANKAEHAELTKKAWTKARELAKAKGGKPQDHMKQAWELIRN